MNNRNTLARQSIPGRNGVVQTFLHLLPPFDLSRILQVSWYGLPCACCYDHSQWSPISEYYSDTSGRRAVHFCHHCNAIICRSCAIYITGNRDGQQLGCAWCGSEVDPNSMTFFLSDVEQNSPSFQCYAQANENIRFLCQNWANSMRITYQGHSVSELYWADMVRSIGWRFFADLKDLLTVQHPSQFRFLMSLMNNNQFSHSRNYEQLALVGYTNFKQLPDHMQFVYHKSRRDVLKARLSEFMISAIPRASFFFLRRSILSKISRNLLAALGICPCEAQEIDFSDESM